jgi:hypothetical protein
MHVAHGVAEIRTLMKRKKPRRTHGRCADKVVLMKMSKPTWSNTSGCSTTPVFCFRRGGTVCERSAASRSSKRSEGDGRRCQFAPSLRTRDKNHGIVLAKHVTFIDETRRDEQFIV